jgi:lipid-A-disaccharide synthase
MKFCQGGLGQLLRSGPLPEICVREWISHMRIFFSVGEPSGDQHTARLIHELKAKCPTLETEGFGGPEMRAAGCSVLFELTELAVMGFMRVVPMLAKFYRVVSQAEQYFDRNPPDVVVLVDFPGFNWWIARAAKKRGIPVYYYLPPQLWAWAPWRIKRVRKWVDHVICTLPFEYDWYRSRGVKCTWVGHPFFDQVQERVLDQQVMKQISGNQSGPVVALLPGSRNHEIEKNWPVMLEVARRVSAVVPGVRWVVGNYKQSQVQRCQELQQAASSPVSPEYFSEKTSEVIEAADCCLMVSGSISLELLARRKPGIVIYRVPVIEKLATKVLKTCRFITLTNLIADEEVMPELISAGDPEADIRTVVATLTKWLTQPTVLSARKSAMSRVADRATNPGASQRTAEFLLSDLGVAMMDSTANRKAA